MAATVLVTAIGSMSAECVLRSLSSCQGIRVLGSDLHPASWLTTASLVQGFYQLPSARQEQEYIESMLRICRQESVSHLMPLTDLEVDVISGCRERFLELGVTVCLPTADCVEVCRDKLKLHDHFSDVAGVRVIPSCPLPQWHGLGVGFPLLAKPRKGRSSEGVVKLEGEQDVVHLLRRDHNHDYIVQPYYPGSVHVVDVVRCALSASCSLVCRKELIRTSNGAGLSVALHHDAALRGQAELVAQRLDVQGGICMEFLEYAGEYFLMDVNPRFSAGVVFSNMAGYDMVLNALRCFAGGGIDSAVAYPEMVIARGYYQRITSGGE